MCSHGLTTVYTGFWTVVDQLQDAFAPILDLLRASLKNIVGTREELADYAPNSDNQPTQGRPMDLDEDDGFGPALIAEEDKALTTSAQVDPNHSSKTTIALIRSLSTCLIRIPTLQSGSTEPSRQDELLDLLDECDPCRFATFGSTLFDAIRLGQLHIGASAADRVLEAFQEYFSSYRYSRDENMHLLALDFLDATSQLWLQPVVSDADFGIHVRLTASYYIKQLGLGKLRSARVRSRFLRFLEGYLARDPTEAFWRLSLGDEQGRLTSPRGFTLPLSRDVHVAVRFEAAIILPGFFDSASRIKSRPHQWYSEFFNEADVLGSSEQQITTALLLANTIVISAVVRKAVYFHFLELAHNHPEASLAHLEVALRSTASVLGLGSLFALWEVYAPAVELNLWSFQREGEVVPDISPSLLGYSSRKLNADMLLRRFGAFLVSRGVDDRFLELCRTSVKTDQEGYLGCLSGSIACQLCHWAERPSDKVLPQVERLIRLAGLEHSVPGYLAESFDAILAACLSQVIDAQTIEEALQDSKRVKQLETYRELDLPKADPSHAESLLAPRATPEMIIQALDWLVANSGKTRMSSDAIVFNVLFDLTTRAGKTPLIIEQIRIVYSVSLLISLYQSSFTNVTVLRALLHLSTVLMSQLELVPIVHGILRWAIDRLVLVTRSAPGVGEVLVRVAHLAHSLAARPPLTVAQTVGTSLLDHLEAAIQELVVQETSISSQAREALSVWPRPLSSELALACLSSDPARLSTILVSAMG